MKAPVVDPSWIPDPNRPGKHIDPKTGIAPIAEWGPWCARGFVSNERFARGGESVIKRTNRAAQRKQRSSQVHQPGKTSERLL